MFFRIFLILSILFFSIPSDAKSRTHLRVEGLDVFSPPSETSTPVLTQKRTEILSHYTIKYADLSQIKASLPSLFEGVKVTVDDWSRSVSVLSPSHEISDHVRTLIRSWDQPLPQIALEIEVYEVGHTQSKGYQTFLSELGDGFSINYDFDRKKILPSNSLLSLLSALQQNGDAKLIAQPRILTLDHHLAFIKIGDELPYVTTVTTQTSQTQQVHFLDVGIEVSLTPQLVTGNTLIVKLLSKFSTVKFWKQIEGTEFPVLSARQTDTMVQMKDQETLVIAGMLDESTHKTSYGVPFLENLPWIGSWFKSDKMEVSQSDVIFKITPRVMK